MQNTKMGPPEAVKGIPNAPGVWSIKTDHFEHLAGGVGRIAGLTSCLIVDESAHEKDFFEKSFGEEEMSR